MSEVNKESVDDNYPVWTFLPEQEGVTVDNRSKHSHTFRKPDEIQSRFFSGGNYNRNIDGSLVFCSLS